MTSTQEQSNEATAVIATAAPRRREKLFNLLRIDPLEVLSLAVHFDERRHDENLFLVPLESAHLYDSDLFLKVIEFLTEKQQQKRQLDNIDGNLPSWSMSALTPIVLSGLLTACDTSPTIDMDLVMACQAMRQAALERVRARRRRRKRLRFVLPALSVLIVVGIYVKHVVTLQRLIHDLQYGISCNNHYPNYNTACRLAEVQLWERFRDSLNSLLTVTNQACPTTSWLVSSLPAAPCVLHTTLSRHLLTLEDVHQRRRGVSVTTTVPIHGQVDAMQPCRWSLGESIINTQVQKAIEQYRSFNQQDGLTILDVGCGVGGTLHAFLSSSYATNNNRTFDYHGISLSAAEIHHAQQLFQYSYSILPSHNITFATNSMDDTLGDHRYNTIVAIESLSYSKNLSMTLENMAQSLQPGGVMILVEDVWVPTGDGRRSAELLGMYRPSVTTHAIWIELLKQVLCNLQEAINLGMEYELVDLSTEKKITTSYRTMWQNQFLDMILFQKDRSEFHQAQELRAKLYQEGLLAYHMYICVKDVR